MSFTPSEKSMKEGAKLAHSLWSHWMQHYFSLKDPSEHYERWINLMHRPFDQLTEKEKESDYKVGLEIALALDQREQSVWEEALKAVPEQESRPDHWGKGAPLFDALTLMGFNLTGDKNWDGVEFHFRIFGHLPEKITCRMWSCDEQPNGGREKVGLFVESVWNAARRFLLSARSKSLKE